jgi:hypothetical protein
MGSRQIVLVSTAGISVHNAGIFWREAKTKRLFSQCRALSLLKLYPGALDFNITYIPNLDKPPKILRGGYQNIF